MGDCSGKVQAGFYWIGKKVRRVTAKDMAEGKGGWIGHYVSYSVAPACTLVFFTFKESREDGHVGILLIDTDQMVNFMAHASYSHNRFMKSKIALDLKNGFYTHMSNLRKIE